MGFLMVMVYSFIQIAQNILEDLQMEKEMAKVYILTQIVVNGKVNGRTTSALLVMG